jgi:hypothetical protein
VLLIRHRGIDGLTVFSAQNMHPAHSHQVVERGLDLRGGEALIGELVPIIVVNHIDSLLVCRAGGGKFRALQSRRSLSVSAFTS